MTTAHSRTQGPPASELDTFWDAISLMPEVLHWVMQGVVQGAVRHSPGSLAEVPPGLQDTDNLADPYTQARRFLQGQAPDQRRRLATCLAAELRRLNIKATRQRLLGHLRVIDDDLAAAVAHDLGLPLEDIEPAQPAGLKPPPLRPATGR